MLAWLKEYSYLAGWFAIPVSVVVALMSVKGKRTGTVDWATVVLRFIYMMSLVVCFASGIDPGVRWAAGAICLGIMVYNTTPRKR